MTEVYSAEHVGDRQVNPGALHPASTRLRWINLLSMLLLLWFLTTQSHAQNSASFESTIREGNILLRQLNLPDTGEFTFLEQQIYRGEAVNAQQQLETIITQIETLHDRYDENLITPLTLLGDAYVAQNNFDQALDYYDRARHTARVSYGLFDVRQLPVVYREADVFRKMGDLASSGQREEYAFEVMAKSAEATDPQLLSATMRLGKFYLETFNYLSARALFNQALAYHDNNDSGYSPEAIPALHGVALSHRLERFPPIYINSAESSRLSGPSPGLNNRDLEGQYATFNSFPKGEKALQRIVEIRRRQDPQDLPATLGAILDLADWHLLFGREKTAHTLYTHVYEEMSAAEADPGTFFGQPKLLHFPVPPNPRPPAEKASSDPSTGIVTLGFNVTPGGRIRKLKTLESRPPDLMEFRVRRSMRVAIFRPMLVDAEPIMATDQSYTHEFAYFPTPAQALALDLLDAENKANEAMGDDDLTGEDNTQADNQPATEEVNQDVSPSTSEALRSPDKLTTAPPANDLEYDSTTNLSRTQPEE